jgi:hypothetical protein
LKVGARAGAKTNSFGSPHRPKISKTIVEKGILLHFEPFLAQINFLTDLFIRLFLELNFVSLIMLDIPKNKNLVLI